LGEGCVNSLQLHRNSALWAATEGGLSRLKNGRAATLTRKSGLPCDTVLGAVEDDTRSFWLYMDFRKRTDVLNGVVGGTSYAFRNLRIASDNVA